MNILDFGHGIVVRFKSIRPKQSATFHVTRKDMRKATGVTPETWDCIDCGVNTAPRIPGRAETLRNIGRFGKSRVDLRPPNRGLHGAQRCMEARAHEACRRLSMYWLLREASWPSAKGAGFCIRSWVQWATGHQAIIAPSR